MVFNFLNRFLFWSPIFGSLSSLILLIIAFSYEYFGGLVPCQMCEWQRWSHLGVILFCFFSFLSKNYSYQFFLLAGFFALLSSIIGGWHAGIETGLFKGLESCSNFDFNTNINLLDLLETPIKNCDVVVWSFLGLSMAAWNAILSFIIFFYCIFFGFLKRKAENVYSE